MATVYRQLFDGTNGTVVGNGGSDYTPDVGAKFPNAGNTTVLNGSGVAVLSAGGASHHYSPVAASNDGTLFFSMRNNTNTTQNGVNVFVRGGTAQFGNEYRLNVDWFGGGLRLISTADGTVASFNPGVSAATFITGRLVIQGFRIRVWVGSNVGTPDIDWTDPNSRYASGRVGWWADTTGSDIAEFEWDDAVLIPGGSVPPLASPAQVRSRRFRGHPFRTLTFRGNGVAAGGPTYLDITSASSLRSLLGGNATVDPRASSAGSLRTLLGVTPTPGGQVASATTVRTLSQVLATLDPAIASAIQLRTLLAALPTLTLPIETATLIRSAFAADVVLDSAVVLDIVAATLIRALSETTVTLLPTAASASQLRTLGAAAVTTGPAVASATLLRTLTAGAATPQPLVSLATALRTLGSSSATPSPSIALATALRTLGGISATLDPAVAGGSVLRTLGAVPVGLTIPIAGANLLRSEFIALITLDPAVPILEVTSSTLIRHLSGTLVTLDPVVAGGSTLRTLGASLASLGLPAPHGMTQRVLTGTAVLPTLPVLSATLWRWESSTLVTVLLPGDGVLRWVTFAVLTRPALTRETAAAPAMTTDAAIARALRWQRAALPSFDQENP